jgi:hypothetical protein
MNDVHDLIARANRRMGKTAATVRNGVSVRVSVDAAGREKWSVLKGKTWKRLSYSAVRRACEGE